jgi:hypothetical protein
MASALTTTYFGHDIRIEPFEWGYLAQVVDARSKARFVAANASAFRALEEAFNVIDESRNHSRSGGPVSGWPGRSSAA